MDEQQPGAADADADAGAGGRPAAPSLTIDVGGVSRTVHPGDDAVTIGREPPSQILLAESGVSRTHLRIQYVENGWTVTDIGSRNGTFVDGERVQHLVVTTTVTVHLGDPRGAALYLVPQLDVPQHDGPSDHGAPSADIADAHATARVGAAVRQRREELGLSQILVADVMTLAEYTRFEDGQLWPEPGAQSALEQRLAWPTGTLAALRDGADVPEMDQTDLLSPTVRLELVLDAAEIEVRAIRRRLSGLPQTNDPRFLREITPMLTQLRRLDRLATAAARTAPARPEVAAALAGVRQTRAELLLLAANSPLASLGQRLGAVRHSGHLTVAEIATAAAVTIADVEAAEREDTSSAGVVEALERVVSAIDHRLRAME